MLPKLKYVSLALDKIQVFLNVKESYDPCTRYHSSSRSLIPLIHVVVVLCSGQKVNVLNNKSL